MTDGKKIDLILKHVKKTNILIESISMIINTTIVGIMTVFVVKTIFNK